MRTAFPRRSKVSISRARLACVAAAVAAVAVAVPRQAHADEPVVAVDPASAAPPDGPAATPPAPPVAPEAGDGDRPAPAFRGFQLALRTGYAIPSGQTSGEREDDLARLYSGEVPLVADLGFKVTDHIFLGGYVGAGLGGRGGSGLETSCKRDGILCSQTTFHVGAQIQYHFAPSERINPWIGYGVGFESSSASLSNGVYSYDIKTSGPELARFMVGLDIGATELLGVGPYAELTVAQYTSFSRPDDAGARRSFEPDTALHQWFSVGLRAVFNR